MKHVFVFDPKSFYGQQWKMDGILDHIGQFFRTQEKPDFSIQISRYRRDAIVMIQEEAKKAAPGDIVRIYAVGGEELLFDCINAIAHYPNMQIASVPYGEKNDFLNIFGNDKIESFRDIETLVKSDTLSTDLIRWGVNYALNSCYIGLSTVMTARIKDMKASLGKGAFIVLSKVLNFTNYITAAFDTEVASQKYHIFIDDQDYSGRYSLIHIANGPYHAGKKTGLYDATPDDGFLDVALIKSSVPLATMFAMRKYSKGKRPKNCTFVQAKKINIQSDKPMSIQMDNEHFKDTNITLSVVPNAVQVVAVGDSSYPVPVISGL